jgi:hypothetical protein
LCSVHDAIEFEKRGIPATVVLTRIFRNPCEYQFKSKGMEGHPYIELPHPVSQLTPPQMSALTSRYIDEVVRQLTAQ